MEKRIAVIRESPVELCKILKFENIAGSGGEAKCMIADGRVKVNGEVEIRKRKKILPGDIIQVGDIQIEIRGI
ncbi:MAG: RNA-binding S4 domain-containing protein [Proteobacteria bacterium]|nr:RNA-binding S4 domain-containing protein [Pseudomonadota bacterium]MBU1388134.1 RNA-binding S4 domain-containing protein [Pseudomonadota bacterium]MBU1542198.1 RNA-binding S4 domain-containing protein [Pseudomonadota bacterium]MBU2431172.1 RNA-binding S4 domain-containing protein [Pseudomonadota bacterium]MBU2481646.1 RNA-binding S4 domain-containing protein [Pseudomonadota bacterium]